MKKIVSIVLFISAFINPLQSAAPVVHIYCAELYFKHCQPTYTQKEKDSFIRGTLFPDIRYIARIPRAKTHTKNVNLQDVKVLKDAFLAGKLFHSYVDEQRERIARKHKIYDQVADVPQKLKSQFVKAVEDEMAYKNINSKNAAKALKSYDSHENNAGINVVFVMAWHRVLQDYVKQSPLIFMKRKAAKKEGYFKLTPDQVKQSVAGLEKYSNDKKFKAYFADFLKDFEGNLKTAKKPIKKTTQPKAADPLPEKKSS